MFSCCGEKVFLHNGDEESQTEFNLLYGIVWCSRLLTVNQQREKTNLMINTAMLSSDLVLTDLNNNNNSNNNNNNNNNKKVEEECNIANPLLCFHCALV